MCFSIRVILIRLLQLYLICLVFLIMCCCLLKLWLVLSSVVNRVCCGCVVNSIFCMMWCMVLLVLWWCFLVWLVMGILIFVVGWMVMCIFGNQLCGVLLFMCEKCVCVGLLRCIGMMVVLVLVVMKVGFLQIFIRFLVVVMWFFGKIIIGWFDLISLMIFLIVIGLFGLIVR